jgi:chaperonin GroEL
LATGAQFISEDVGLELDEVELDVLGSAESIIISKDDTIIMGGKGESEEVA